MLEINDYSSRRGVIVQLLPQIHALLKANAQEKLTNLVPPEHVITWTQKMRRVVLDINRRFIVAVDGGNLAGIFFYRSDLRNGKKIFFEDVQVSSKYKNNPLVIDGFLKKLEFDQNAKDATFYASERIKIDFDKELLAAKGFKVEHEDGWEKLGDFKDAAGALKIRYNRGIAL
jgi:hypothetical protein